MPRRKRPAIPPAPRKTLLEWIEFDDGDTIDFAPPACSAQTQSFHAQLLLASGSGTSETPEPLEPPPGLRLPPLG